MPLDEDARLLIEAMSEQGMPRFEQMTPAQVRDVVATFVGLQAPRREVARVVDGAYPGPSGPQPLRIYVPDGATPLPVVVYFHGGGFVGGGLDVVDEPARALANDLGAIVVTASYRLAPEAKFPAATDDTFAALKWVAEHVDEFGGDRARIAVMGDSAGGNLAAVAALRARDEGGPDLIAQILVYPVIDAAARLASRTECSDGYVITAAAIDWFWEQYLRSPADAQSPLATPSKSASHSGLPPALVLATEFEVSRDEAMAYGRQLEEAGVDTEIVRIDGLIHGAYWMSGAVPRSREIHDAIVGFLSRRFENMNDLRSPERDAS
jgi:acetyl esterase